MDPTILTIVVIAGEDMVFIHFNKPLLFYNLPLREPAVLIVSLRAIAPIALADLNPIDINIRVEGTVLTAGF